MKPLQDKFHELSDLLIHHRNDLAQGTGVPFVRLIYRPEEERECRRLTVTLRDRLANTGFSADEIHCGEFVFKYYAEHNQTERRLETARDKPLKAGDEIGRHAETALFDEIVTKAHRAGAPGNIILSETGMLYPFAHLAGILDRCENKVNIPLVILYPATLSDDRLLFMGKRDPGYYRTRDLI